VGCLTRTPNGRYPEYHTSADNLSLVRPESLADSLASCLAIVDVLEHDATYVNLAPCGEPQLGRRGLYRKSGGQPLLPEYEMAMLWVLNLSDGGHSLLDIAERSRIRFDLVSRAAADLLDHDLLRIDGTR
jgi:aminopeptidase-like protein